MVYGRDRMMSLAREFFYRFGSNAKPEEFRQFDKRDWHPQWDRKAEDSIYRIAGMWQSLGLEFPIGQVMQDW